MINRRRFLSGLAGSGLAAVIPAGLTKTGAFANNTSASLKTDEIDWLQIRHDFLAPQHKLINLNNGSSGIMPIPVLESYKSFTEEVNSFAPYYVLDSWKDLIQQNLLRLASLLGADEGHIAFVRNTTEAVNIILSGIDWQSGDEIITADWDYPFVEYTVEQLANREGIIVNNIDQSLPGLSDEEIVEAYRKKITAKSRLIVVTWMTHREGQLLPVKDIIDMAHSLDVEVMLDGAHIAGQLDINLSELQADYFASSLHKWLNAPLGSGVMYMGKSQIEKHFPYLSYDPSKKLNPEKYSYLGTRPFQNLATLGSALDYLDKTGLQAKNKRLHELSLYWIEALKDQGNMRINTNPKRCCAVASLSIGDLSSGKIKKIMNEKFDVHVKSSAIAGRPMIRVSPNIYTSFEELDRFIEAAYYIDKNY